MIVSLAAVLVAAPALAKADAATIAARIRALDDLYDLTHQDEPGQ